MSCEHCENAGPYRVMRFSTDPIWVCWDDLLKLAFGEEVGGQR